LESQRLNFVVTYRTLPYLTLGGTLDGTQLQVTSQEHPDGEEHASGSSTEHITQEDKPRTGIAAEYLAKGYQLSDQILQRVSRFHL
jgi:hypothetical protein